MLTPHLRGSRDQIQEKIDVPTYTIVTGEDDPGITGISVAFEAGNPVEIDLRSIGDGARNELNDEFRIFASLVDSRVRWPRAK